MKKASAAKRIAYLGMLTALAMIMSYVESLIPIGLGIPGIKIGLANLVVLTGLYYLKPQEVILVSVTRILLIGFLFGNGVSVIYSLAGGIVSFFVMLLIKKTGAFSVIGASVAGAVSHNIAQLVCAALIVRTAGLVWYAPALLAAGVAAGVLIGILSSKILPVIRKIIADKE